MREAGRRPMGRLFYWARLYWALTVMAASFGLGLAAAGVPVPQSGPPTTAIADSVYLADGSPAQGTLIITWPAFVTAGGAAVAGGSTSVTLGTNGSLNVALVPNVGATPAGIYYTVVYQLQPGGVKTEYWLVPTSSSPVTVAMVVTTPGSGSAAQPVSMQYLNSQLAGVVHLGGAETITGVKSFNVPPNVPAPVNSGDVANKSYVDGTVQCLNASTWAKGSSEPSAISAK